jgi:hypothetical protein
MRTSDSWRGALSSFITAAMLAGCGAQSPLGAPGPPGTTGATGATRHTSWMLPEAQNEDLLYVTTSGHGSFGDGGYVSVFAYPKGTLVGTLTAFSSPNGACVDKAGNIFLPDTNDREIFEYAHGGSESIGTLADGQQPYGCSIDPIAGSLAVANADGSVSIYRNSKGIPKTYHDPILIDAYYCAYDSDGNLFVDGFNYYNSSHNFQLVELPHGKSSFRNITLDETLVTPTGVQWDGKYVVVGDGYPEHHAVYRVEVSGTEGVVKQEISLTNADPEGFWIDGRRLINPDYFTDQVQYFKYPAAGSATKVITSVEYASAAAVSPAKPSPAQR